MKRPIALFTAIAVAAAPAAVAAAPSMKVEGAWARATPPGAATGAIYLTVVNDSASTDRLVGASTPAAAKAEPHAMSMKGGIMTMRPAKDGLAVPARGVLMLAPSGDHLMLTGLKGPLKTGAKIPLTLRFASATLIKVEIPVRDDAPSHDHMRMRMRMRMR